MIEELYRKYQSSNLTIRKHSLKEINSILKQKFQAEDIDKMDFQELKNDPYIYFDDICAGYKINGDIVTKLLMDDEKELYEVIYNNILNDDALSDVDKQKEYDDINTVLIFLQSKDLQYPMDDVYSVVTGYVPSVVFHYIMMILEGHAIDEDKHDMHNYEFQAYLKALHIIGYLV
ncbi:hypothetical protein CN692_24770 [Bacillus sp. AFS002410]|uniref:hypothetical protein n=1 Tax=Bacillus sp. AFS002410 TaxID=2033481 RepID=UPI000BF22658|nr:hypothetical protein [Bacillus sp. AFS002410]PEJ47764.1 hypothetical protein CN692_24770 [Bacillus sp. AFS002410]